ncbi:MAG: PhoPQ-activated pathogenicity-like protein PqaA type [Deferribacteres bacterium]|nr:PhoPQ-activated pathogenicity-related family protein [candidate division KSB1 bacterium]MCB9500858.1 PhoPQ-activated pathogenicity-like protein PqaA type [Deferribacteres bacterium]
MKHANQVHTTKLKKIHLLKFIGFIGVIFFFLIGCGTAEAGAANTGGSSPLDQYVAKPDASFKYELRNSIEGDGYKTHVVYMVSGTWLTTAEVKDPVWWHWVTIVVPDSLASDTSLLFITGGSRRNQMPDKADESFVKIALATGSVVTALHNVPNQPLEFVGDSYGPRKEDEIISYAWRQYLEAGATEEASRWLPRLPMTNAAVRTMDVVSELSPKLTGRTIDKFVVAGGSKRGWTTWTTAIADKRVVAIMPIVIDMLNLIPSFEHHWQVYGFWAPAVGDYVSEGVMEWQNSQEYQKLMNVVEPYNFRDRLTMPKLLINASGDQFFLPDSWQFYWKDLKGEKHIRYVPNANHSLRRSDAIETVAAFHHAIINNKTRPDFDWIVKDGAIELTTNTDQPPTSITLWQATNATARDFRVETIGRTWTSAPVELREDGKYKIRVDAPENGWTAFFAELTFPELKDIPLKFSTGVVVVPDVLPYPRYESPAPQGTPVSGKKD